MPSPATKLQQIRFLRPDDEDEHLLDPLAVSTEDGRIIVFAVPLDSTSGEGAKEGANGPLCEAIGHVGEGADDVRSRIKDFAVLDLQMGVSTSRLVVAAGSDGAIRLWILDRLRPKAAVDSTVNGNGIPPTPDEAGSRGLAAPSVSQVGTLAGVYETGNRITCLSAFILLPRLEVEGLNVAASDD